MSENNATVAVYNTHQEAQDAIKALQNAAFDMKKLSIVGRDYHTEEHVVGYYNTGDRVKYWGKLGALWGGLAGLLAGTAFLLVPGVGPVLVAGPLAAYILSALEGAVFVGGMSAIGGGLFSIGIPKNSILKYESALKADKFLIIVHGTQDEVNHAKEIIQTTKPAEVSVHLGEATEKVAASNAIF